jgi:hypothetical protein
LEIYRRIQKIVAGRIFLNMVENNISKDSAWGELISNYTRINRKMKELVRVSSSIDRMYFLRIYGINQNAVLKILRLRSKVVTRGEFLKIRRYLYDLILWNSMLLFYINPNFKNRKLYETIRHIRNSGNITSRASKNIIFKYSELLRMLNLGEEINYDFAAKLKSSVVKSK